MFFVDRVSSKLQIPLVLFSLLLNRNFIETKRSCYYLINFTNYRFLLLALCQLLKLLNRCITILYADLLNLMNEIFKFKNVV